MVGSASSALAQPECFDQSQATAKIQEIQAASGSPSLSAAIIRLDGQDISTALTLSFHATPRSGAASFDVQEVGIYAVRNGKIVRKQFFYDVG
jgi:hypothetical protein